MRKRPDLSAGRRESWKTRQSFLAIGTASSCLIHVQPDSKEEADQILKGFLAATFSHLMRPCSKGVQRHKQEESH